MINLEESLSMPTPKQPVKTLTGIYVPLITPFYKGKFDPQSLKKLIQFTAPEVNGFVPCLSSGEGGIVSDAVWEDVVRCARTLTKKTVIAGVKRNDLAATIKLSKKAERIGCDAVMVPVPYADEAKALNYFRDLAAAIKLPIVVYNTEQHRFKSIAAIQELQKNTSIIGMKDSSMNEKLFARMCKMRVQKTLRFPVFQGMEHQMHTPPGCDGHIVALANVEPKLCRDMWSKNSLRLNARIIDLFWRYNLGGAWYVTLKSILAQRKIIRSAEETALAIRPQ
jgi:4-hydroxy-tetrahydrodipicolinate synthase